MVSPKLAVFGVDYTGTEDTLSKVITKPADIEEALEEIKSSLPTILANEDRTEWRYVPIRIVIQALSQNIDETHSCHLAWIPPYDPKHLAEGLKDLPFDNNVFVVKIQRIYTLNPFLALIAWWKGKDTKDLRPQSRFFADIACMAGFSGWFSIMLFPEGTLVRWLIPTILVGLVVVGYSFSSIIKWWKNRKNK